MGAQSAPDPNVAGVEGIAAEVADWLKQGRGVILARVAAIKGFSTWPTGELLAVVDGGDQAGALLGRAGTTAVRDAVGAFASSAGAPPLLTTTVSVRGEAVVEAGLSCGGEAELLLQPAERVPGRLWEALANGERVALLTALNGPQIGENLVVGMDGSTVVTSSSSSGATGLTSVPGLDEVVSVAAELLVTGQSTFRQLAAGDTTVLLETWVPPPRLVVVGDGDLVTALRSQAGLLGWDLDATNQPDDAVHSIEAAGVAAAVVVLSHDARVDKPALVAALTGRAFYVGALGSRRTQAARAERLGRAGITEADIARIRGPIGLNLGGRSAPEVALAICAEIQAIRCGRDASSLRDAAGPITGRPADVPALARR